MSYWEASKSHVGSFMGRTTRFGKIDGPTELYSFSSRTDRPSKPDPERPGKADPMYFLAGSALTQAIRGARHDAEGKALRETIRQGIALCEDWNAMTYLFILEVPAGFHVEAWFGLAKFQPRIERGDAGGQSFGGGWLQYIVDLNELTSMYLRGPIATGW